MKQTRPEQFHTMGDVATLYRKVATGARNWQGDWDGSFTYIDDLIVNGNYVHRQDVLLYDMDLWEGDEKRGLFVELVGATLDNRRNG